MPAALAHVLEKYHWRIEGRGSGAKDVRSTSWFNFILTFLCSFRGNFGQIIGRRLDPPLNSDDT